MWVLILTVVYNSFGVSTTTQEFSSKAGCVAAAKQHNSSMYNAKNT